MVLSPSSAYSQVGGEDRYIALYQKDREDGSPEVKLHPEEIEFPVDKSISLELLGQLKRNGSEIKFVVEHEYAIVGIQF